MTFMDDLDASIVNVALPVINQELRTNMATAELIVSIYLVTICLLLLPFGKLGDMIGKVRVFEFGMFLFTCGSILSGLSRSINFLLVARLIQAVGAAMTMSTNNGIITETFPIELRGQALGWIGSFVALGMIAGPGIGGVLLAFLPWQSIFWINVPIGIVLMIVGWFILPSNVGIATKFNWRQFWPLVNLSIFKTIDFSVGLLTAMIIFITNNFYMVLTPFYLENTKLFSASITGLIMMLLPLVQSVIAPISGRLTDQHGPWKIAMVGLSIILLAQLGLTMLTVRSSVFEIGLVIGLLGLGNAVYQSPNNTMIMGAVQPNQLGAAGSINALARNLGMVIGNILATGLLFAIMSSLEHHSVTNYTGTGTQYFMIGQHWIYGFSIILVVGALLLSLKRSETIKH